MGRSKDVNIRIAKGVFWAGTTQVITQAISFAVNVIVARLLYPDDFGILGMAAMSLDLMGTITDLGLNSAIIQRHEVTEEQLSTCFWINVLVGIALLGGAVVCAPTIAGFFKKGLVGPVIVVSSFGFLLRAAGGVHRATLTKRLDFKRLTVPEIISILFFSITVIPMAWGGIGLWSVVIANLAGGIASTIALWVLHPWRPAWRFSWRSSRKLVTFGSNVIGEQVLSYINYNIDYLLIGRILGAWSLGIYTLAFNLMTYPLRKIAQTVTRVVFPAFSQMQGDNELLQEGYLRTVRYIALVTFPILTGLAITSSDFIRLIYGEKWIAAVLPLQIMCLDGLVRTISTTTGSLQYAKGRADIALKWKIFTVLIVPPAIAFGTHYGVVGVAIAVAASEIFLAPIIQVITNNLIGLQWRPFCRAMKPAAVGVVIMAAWLFFLIWMKSRLWPEAQYTCLITTVASGAVVYMVSVWFFFRDVYREMVNLVRDLRIKNNVKMF